MNLLTIILPELIKSINTIQLVIPYTSPMNDIALIKLDRLISSIKTIEGNEHFKSICLPKKQYL